MAIPDLQKLRDPTGKVAIRPEKSDGTLGEELSYDVASAEWQLDGDRVLTTSDVGSSGGLLEEGDNISLTTNSSTGGTVVSTEVIIGVDQGSVLFKGDDKTIEGKSSEYIESYPYKPVEFKVEKGVQYEVVWSFNVTNIESGIGGDGEPDIFLDAISTPDSFYGFESGSFPTEFDEPSSSDVSWQVFDGFPSSAYEGDALAATGVNTTSMAEGDVSKLRLTITPSQDGIVKFYYQYDFELNSDAELEVTANERTIFSTGGVDPILNTLKFYESSGALDLGVRDPNSVVGLNSVVLSGGRTISDTNNVNNLDSIPTGIATGEGSLAHYDSDVRGDGSAGFNSSEILSDSDDSASFNRSTVNGFSSFGANQSTIQGLDSVGNPPNGSFAANYGVVDTGDGASAFGKATVYAGRSFGVGEENTVRTFSSTVVGVYNEDYIDPNRLTNGSVGFGLDDIQDNDRMFTVGVGDNSNGSPGDNDYYDGRGRVDGFYVTMRDGTYIRHGLSVDGYNASLGDYETNFEVNSSGQLVGDIEVTGDVEVTEPGAGTILTSPDGTRFRVHVENDGTIVSTELP